MGFYEQNTILFMETPMKDKQAQALLRRAYELDGANDEETKALYRDWAETYDGTMIDGLGYVSPMKIAALTAQLVPDRAARIRRCAPDYSTY